MDFLAKAMPKTNNPAATAALKAFIVPPVSRFTVFFNYCFARRGSQLLSSSVPLVGEMHFASNHSPARTRLTLKNIGIVQTCRSAARLQALQDTSPGSRHVYPAEKDKHYPRRTSPQSPFGPGRTQVPGRVRTARNRSLLLCGTSPGLRIWTFLRCRSPKIAPVPQS